MVAISLADCATFPGMLRSWQETASSGGRDWRHVIARRLGPYGLARQRLAKWKLASVERNLGRRSMTSNTYHLGVVPFSWTVIRGGAAMAKYSKEQRRCAVELYVRYECCVADVIRELGYPSREALRMWHRDWLEEQRTGTRRCVAAVRLMLLY